MNYHAKGLVPAGVNTCQFKSVTALLLHPLESKWLLFWALKNTCVQLFHHLQVPIVPQNEPQETGVRTKFYGQNHSLQDTSPGHKHHIPIFQPRHQSCQSCHPGRPFRKGRPFRNHNTWIIHPTVLNTSQQSGHRTPLFSGRFSNLTCSRLINITASNPLLPFNDKHDKHVPNAVC